MVNASCLLLCLVFIEMKTAGHLTHAGPAIRHSRRDWKEVEKAQVSLLDSFRVLEELQASWDDSNHHVTHRSVGDEQIFNIVKESKPTEQVREYLDVFLDESQMKSLCAITVRPVSELEDLKITKHIDRLSHIGCKKLGEECHKGKPNETYTCMEIVERVILPQHGIQLNITSGCACALQRFPNANWQPPKYRA